MTWIDLIWGVAELATDLLPGGKTIKKLAKNAVGGWKDFRSGTNFDFDGLSADLGNLKNGLAGAKAQIETQGKELHGKIDTVKSELQNQLKSQGEKFDQEIQFLDAKIASLQGEQKKTSRGAKISSPKAKRGINEKY